MRKTFTTSLAQCKCVDFFFMATHLKAFIFDCKPVVVDVYWRSQRFVGRHCQTHECCPYFAFTFVAFSFEITTIAKTKNENEKRKKKKSLENVSAESAL